MCSRSWAQARSRAALYSSGSCQPRYSTTNAIQTAPGPASFFNPSRSSPRRPNSRPNPILAWSGSPQSKKGRGLASQSIGGTILTSRTCWIMCIKNNWELMTSMGDIKARPRISRPPRYNNGRHLALACQGLIPWRSAVLFRSRHHPLV